MRTYRKMMPPLSETEKIALESGDTWWEAELIGGQPSWKTLHQYPKPKLTEEEQSFLDGPVNQLCSMIDDFEITHVDFGPSEKILDFLSKEGFFSFIIPKAYGGKEFSAIAQSEILMRIAGKSVSIASVVGVPNSLGPGELIMHYGTQEQKDHYLPRLADGREIPCFCLTSPKAGSDAGSIPDYGIICKQLHNGEETIGIRLNFDKRYITLAPIATLFGLAFKCYDPEKILGDKTDYGITCALLPRNLPNLKAGRRHFPLNCAFPNGPVKGQDVFIPLSAVIGGQEMLGHGWRMLTECLSIGRGITLPSNCAGGAQAASLACGAYSRIRRQFNQPIGQFEGIQEILARIGGLTYLMDAVRKFSAGAVDLGKKPAVCAAISKYYVTEMGRQVTLDAMDVEGGKGICLGPNNYLGRTFQSNPIAITVEGANILTRTMMIFGQGAVRAHPYVSKELETLSMTDQNEALKIFDKAFFAHINFVAGNKIRAFWYGLTGAKFSSKPYADFTGRYYQKINRYSATLGFLTDAVMFHLGGNLKRCERLSGRLADCLGDLYMASAVLKHYRDDGAIKEAEPFVKWSLDYLFNHLETQLEELFTNYPQPLLGKAFKFISMPWGRKERGPKDTDGLKIANCLLSPNEFRSYLTQTVYKVNDGNNPIGFQEDALPKIIAEEDSFKKLTKAIKNHEIKALTFAEQIIEATQKGMFTDEQAEAMIEAENLRNIIIAVDDFDMSELARNSLEPKIGKNQEQLKQKDNNDQQSLHEKVD